MKITGQEIYLWALSLMGEELAKAKGYSNFIVPFINEKLADLFKLNNSILESRGEKRLTTIPSIKDISEELTYDEEILRRCMHYGIAAMLVLDDDMSKASYFNFKYDSAKDELLRGVEINVIDVY